MKKIHTKLILMAAMVVTMTFTSCDGYLDVTQRGIPFYREMWYGIENASPAYGEPKGVRR